MKKKIIKKTKRSDNFDKINTVEQKNEIHPFVDVNNQIITNILNGVFKIVDCELSTLWSGQILTIVALNESTKDTFELWVSESCVGTLEYGTLYSKNGEFSKNRDRYAPSEDLQKQLYAFVQSSKKIANLIKKQCNEELDINSQIYTL